MQQWNFDNTYTRLPACFFTRQAPVPVAAPKMIIFNDALAESLGAPQDLQALAGNSIPAGAQPLAQAYMGHQFGHLNMLGDGRAILLGEQMTPNGRRFDIQLKGSGRTPYSRGGDGRAALGPMLREYIISEAMHGLGIPTTRSLAVVATGEKVLRERELPGAILTRVAASHIRVGTFEYAARIGTDAVRVLADYTIERHFVGDVHRRTKCVRRPSVPGRDVVPRDAEDCIPYEKYLALLREVISRQASLIAKWQLVGFIHGVMNTDNMAISGETIDYGPCAFMDAYNPDTVFSSIDREGRYAYKNQPQMAVWNLARFAETLLPLLHENEKTTVEIATAEIENFMPQYRSHWLTGMRAKLGLAGENPGDESLIADLLALMEKHGLDYTNTFRELTLGEVNPVLHDWAKHWQSHCGHTVGDVPPRVPGSDVCPRDAQGRVPHENTKPVGTIFVPTETMQKSNPAVIPRNHRVEEALQAAENGDLSVMHNLLLALKNPYAYTQQQQEYAQPPAISCRYKTFCGT